MNTNTEEAEKMVRGIPARAAKIRKYKDRLSYLEAKSTCLPGMQTDERVQTSGGNHSMAIADTLMDLEAEINKEEKDLVATQRKASLIFAESDLDIEERELLDYRYIRCLKWSDVASLLYIGERTARWRHACIMRKIFSDSEDK